MNRSTFGLIGLLLGSLFVLSGCGIAQRQAAMQAAQERAAEFQTQSRNLIVECRDRKTRGMYRTYSEVVQCVSEPLYTAYQRVGFPYMDLVALALSEVRVEAERADKGEITVAQLNARIAEIQSSGIDKARARAAEAAQTRAAQTQATAAVLQSTAPSAPLFSYKPPLHCLTMGSEYGALTTCQ